MTEHDPYSDAEQSSSASWLTEHVTRTLPRWSLITAGAAALLLLIVALD